MQTIYRKERRAAVGAQFDRPVPRFVYRVPGPEENSFGTTNEVSVLVQGSTWGAIWHMSWPLTVNMLALASMNLFEGWIAGRLGGNAQAAMGIGGQLWFLFMMMTLALSAGTTAVVSRFCGAGEIKSAVQAGRQSVICGFALSALATIVGLTTSRAVMHALGASAPVEVQGTCYLFTCLLSMVPYTALWITNSIFRASGDAFTPMVTMMTVFGLIMTGELLLCIWPFHLGIAGIGVSWTVCSTIGMVLNFRRLKKCNLGAVCDWRAACEEGLSLNWAKRFLTAGIPSCIQDLALIGGSLGVFLVLSKTQHPLIAQAAWAAGFRLEETLSLMPMYGLNLAVSAIVGQNLGAKQPERAAACGWQIMAVGAGVNTIVALAMFSLAPHIAAVLCANNEIALVCTSYIRIVCWSEPMFACWRILSGAMQGAGYKSVPMIATIFSFSILRISLAIFLLNLTHGNEIWIWVTMAATTMVAGLIMVYFWHRGDWKSKLV